MKLKLFSSWRIYSSNSITRHSSICGIDAGDYNRLINSSSHWAPGQSLRWWGVTNKR